MNREQVDFSFLNYHRYSFDTVANGSPYLNVSLLASANFVVPIVGVDFFEDQIGCYMSSSLAGSKHHGLDKISYRL